MPTVFATAEGSTVVASDGSLYLDFFAGAGALNYGHNHPVLRDALIDYLHDGGILHGLDAMTEAKIQFLDKLDEHVLTPKGLRYRVQFCGPTGTNAVEAAIKTSHLFNLMDARGAVSVTERVGLIARVRRNAVAAAHAYLDQRETLGFPLGREGEPVSNLGTKIMLG